MKRPKNNILLKGNCISYLKNHVTIGVPCYNHEKFVEFCLDSIKSQNYERLSVLIIDDASIDNSYKTVEKWINKNPEISVKLLKNENNKGLNYTLNRIINECETEYLCFLASDDALFTSNSISCRVDALKKSPGKMAVISDAKVINNKNEIILESAIEDLYHGDKNRYKSNNDLKYSIINEFSIPGGVLLVRRELYDIIGPYPNLFAEDIYFYLKVIGLELLIFVDKPLAYYRKHSNNTGGNIKFVRQINNTFIVSYIDNLKYYKGIQRLQLLKKLLGQIFVWLKLKIQN